MRIKTEDMLKQKMIRAIKSELKVQKISQSQLGRLVGGISRNHINSILNGNQGVSIQRALEMAHAIGLRVEVTIKKGRK